MKQCGFVFHCSNIFITNTIIFADEIEQEKNEQKDIEHHMKNLKNDMLRLNMLLSKKSSFKEQLQQHNQLMESEFMRALRVSTSRSKLLHLRC